MPLHEAAIAIGFTVLFVVDVWIVINAVADVRKPRRRADGTILRLR